MTVLVYVTILELATACSASSTGLAHVTIIEHTFEDKYKQHAREQAEEKGIDGGKANTAVRETEANRMHGKMDDDIDQVSQALTNAATAKQTTGYWNTWSKAVEKHVMEHNEADKDVIEKNNGRGEVKLITKCPEQS